MIDSSAAHPNVNPVSVAVMAGVLIAEILAQIRRIDDFTLRKTTMFGGHGQWIGIGTVTAGFVVSPAAIVAYCWPRWAVVGQ